MSAITATESNVSDETTGEITRKETVIDPNDLADPNDYEFMTVEWKIPYYCRFLKKFDHWVKSPMFSCFNADWRLELCPNGKTFRKRWIHIQLRKVYSTTKSQYVRLDAHVMDEYDTECSSMTCGSPYEGNNSVYGGPIISRYSWREECACGYEDTMTILCELRSKVRKSEEVVSETTYTEGGDRCIEGKGKESENTDGVTEDVTLPKPTGDEKCIERKGKESENTDGVTEDATLPKPTGIDKLARDFKNLLTSEKDSDVTLKVKNKDFRAHKGILRARSSVFDSMFDHDMSEKNYGVVDIPDCDPEAFQYFLTYLYSASVENISNEIVFSLYFIADKYDVEELKQKCMDFMANNLSVDTFCNVVTLALQHEESALLQTATDFFVKNTIEVIKSVQWQSFLKENPVTANELYLKSFYCNKTEK